MQKFSFNIHALNLSNPEKQKLLNILQQQKPETALVLNDANFASQVADIVPNTILRMTNNDDNAHLKVNSFAEWWRYVKANYTDKRLIVHFDNEPHSNYVKLNAQCIEGIQLLASQGYRGVFGNFSVGTPESNDWRTVLKPTLDLLEEYKDTMFLGLHEYMMYDANLSIPYEIGRYTQITQNVSVIMTEFGFDYIDAIWHNYQKAKVRGWKDHVAFYQSLNAPDPEFVALSNLKQITQDIYNKDNRVKGLCYFCFGDSGGWDNYNAVTWDYLLNNLEEFKTMASQEITKIDPIIVTIEPKSGNVNRREQPNTVSTVHGSLTEATEVNKIAITNDGWSQYQFMDGAWWLRDDVVKITERTSLTVSIANATPEEIADFKELLDKVQTFLKTHDVEFL